MKADFELLYGNYFIGIGQPYVVLTRIDDDDEVRMEWFYCIVKESKTVKVASQRISCSKKNEIPTDVGAIVETWKTQSVSDAIFHKEIFPAIKDNQRLHEISPRLKLEKVDKSFFVQVRKACPGFLEKIKNQTRCAALSEYLDIVFSINVQTDPIYDFPET